MPRRPGDTTPEPPGGRAAERLREFIDQRLPDNVPPPEAIPEQVADAASHAAQSESNPQEARLAQLEQALQQLVEAQQRNEAQLEELAESQKRIEALLKERDSTK